MARFKIHPRVTQDRIHALCMRELYSLDNPGVCMSCGEEADGCEPDAEHYTCEHCDQPMVFGAQQALIAGLYHPDKATKETK